MSAHICDLPPRDGLSEAWTCPECFWSWHFNTIVSRWYRFVL